MKPIIYAVLGIILYAIQNTIIEVRLSKYSTVSLLVGWYMVLLPLAVALYLYQRYYGDGLVMPTGVDVKLLASVAVMFFIADFFYIGAFTSGGNVVSITVLTVLIPVIAALIKFVWVGQIPTPYHFAGFVFALLAVVMIGLGNTKKPIEIPSTGTVVQEVVQK